MSGTEYPKIETLYDRNPDTFAVDPEKFRCAEFCIIEPWLVTEKLDGTNVRVEWSLGEDGYADVQIKGRTDEAQMPPVLLAAMQELNLPHMIGQAFERPSSGILYGEGYGPKIQKGGVYRQGSPSFRLFDVRVGEWWLNWSSVENIAEKLAIRTVAVLHRAAILGEASDMANWVKSPTAIEEGGDSNYIPEGIVARSDPLLFNRKGERVMWKLKHKDFRGKGQR